MENQANRTRLSRTLSIVLGLVILITIAALIYTVMGPKPGDAFTEFYILGPGGKAVAYPTQLRVNEPGTVTLVIINQEYETMSYLVEVKMGDITEAELGPIVLEHGARFEYFVDFTPREAGEGQKVEFLLYNQEQSGVYNSVYLLVDVE